MIVSAGIVPIRITDDGTLFLLLRSWNFWDFPKGRVEKGETPLEAAIRETTEEASIPAENLEFKWGKSSFTTEPFKRGTKVGTYFLALTEQKDIELPVNPELGHPEHHEYKWVNYEDAQKMTNDRIGSVLEWARDLMLQ